MIFDPPTGGASGVSVPALAPGRNRRNEAGGSLVLALVFLVVVSFIALGLANSLGGGLINAVNFRAARSMQSAANSAAELALESLRYNFTPSTLNASPPQPCWGTSSSSPLTIDAQTVDAWCSTRWNPVSTGTRVVTIDVCPSSFDSTACSVSPLLLAVVTFDDYPASGGPVSTAQCTTTCGTDVAINSWVYGAVPPTVASVANGTTACGATTAVVMTGTGFISGSTRVNFLINAGNNVVLSATQVNVVNSTTLTACSPSGSGSNVEVTVTTPVGTSAAGPSGPFFSY